MRNLIVAVAMLVAACPLAAQAPPAVREIGRLERVSSVPLQSVTRVLPMRDGRVLLNDGRARRLVMLDSSLARETVIADTMGTTAEAYGRNAEVLLRFRGDSALLVDMSSLVGLVVSPAGAITRVLAFPQPPGHPAGQQLVLGGRGGGPGVDARGRLVYFTGGSGMGFSITSLPLGFAMDSGSLARLPGIARMAAPADSAAIWRVDLTTRHFDTVTLIRKPGYRTVFKTDASNGLTAIELTPDLLPMVDGWTILPDGTIAVVRGREYRIDWFDGDGRKTSSPKMPFAWERLPDARKTFLVDSAVQAMQAQFDQNTSGRSGRAGTMQFAPNVVARPSIDAMPGVVPAFESGSVHADAEGNVWIRTSTVIKDRPVYDIVNRKGEIFDRVQLPAFRAITGFAPGVVFLAVQDSSNVVRLERARIR